MNADKHAIIRRVPGAWGILFAAARAASVTVEDLVLAGLRRGRASADASYAAGKVAEAHPHLFPALKAWPYACFFCSTEQPRPFSLQCPFCAQKGCSGCVTSGGCPKCRARLEEERAEAAKVQREREALLKEALP